MKKPDHLPQSVWDAAGIFLNAKSLQESSELQRLKKILADPTLSRQWVKLCRSLAGRQLSVFLDLLVTLPVSIDRKFRDKLSEADVLSQEIGFLADELASKMEIYSGIAERHAISIPHELVNLRELLEKTGAIVPDLESVFSVTPSELIREIANAAIGNTPGAVFVGYEYATEGNSSAAADYVRHFDDRVRTYYQNKFPSGFSVGNTDLAQFLSSLLDLEISRESVALNRSRRKNRNI